MSGDVQPRKRKDKKRKKDELGIEEPRGTSAVFGEGDVFMHSHHEHGTGGHWCAKIIFFSLLAVLVTLIGLIILENRGLTELEANAVESRYSGVLEGWLEDAPDDDHHDEHTLELNHHDDDDNTHDEDTQHLEDDDDEEKDHSEEDDEENDDEYGNEEDSDDEDDNEQSNEEQFNDVDDDDDEQASEENDEDNEQEYKDGQEDSQERDIQNNEDEEDDDEFYYGNQLKSEEDQGNINSEEDDNDDEQNEDEIYNKYKNYDESVEKNHEKDEGEKEDEDEHDEQDADEDVDLEKLEKEESEEQLNEEPISTELPALPEDDDDDFEDDENEKDFSSEADREDNELEGPEEDYLEAEDIVDSTLVEHITIPPGKPLVEVEEDVSSEQPPDTLAEEEEYEKRQEELRRQEEKSSHMWLKLTVGCALLVATHAVMRRATRDSQEEEEVAEENESQLTDRRMTLILDEPPGPVPVRKVVEEIPQPKIGKRIETALPIIKPTVIKKQESEAEEEIQSEEEEFDPTEKKELFSDDDDDEDEEIVETPKIVPKHINSVVENKPTQESEPEEDADDPDDVEVIDDEQLEEEVEDEDEEEISDVDDAELLTRLEAKYGKLPEPDRPGQKNKDGGNSIDDDWPGEPSDAYWRRQLDSAEQELRQGEWNAAGEHAAAEALRGSARARWIVARALDHSAEANRDNSLLSRAIAAYLHLLKMNEGLSDKKLLQVTERTLDRIQFRGNYLNAEPVYRLLIRRFPDNPAYRNNLTISFLMANRADLAEDTLKETLKLWPDDRVALAHYGFVLKTSHNRYEEAIEAFQKALEGDAGPANEGRFYYHYGDSLLLLGRRDKAHEVHKRGAALGHFLSPAQRSLYNVPRLKSSPWWEIDETPYTRLARALEKSWKEILKEAEAAKALYEKDKEGLKERGEWSQLDLFARGREIPGRCQRAPVTCSVVKSEPAAVGCRRGQIKFSSMAAGTHVRAHVGPTNCRLRMHLGLSNTKDTYIRVDKEIRQWQSGKTLLFDDSFEHEVWHNGTGTRLVLIVDVWHPQLTANERRQLPAI